MTFISDYEKALGADDFADYLAVTKEMYAFCRYPQSCRTEYRVPHHAACLTWIESRPADCLQCIYVD